MIDYTALALWTLAGSFIGVILWRGVEWVCKRIWNARRQ